jgi:hypothetical protein
LILKQSILTGKFIYENLKKLYVELNELGGACDVVSDEVGQQSVAYKILRETYNAKKSEIKKFEEQDFISK